jgi:hypothetical protein
MTRKDYILLAEVLRIEFLKETRFEHVEAMRAVWGVAKSLCDSLMRDNPRFNSEHFLAVVNGKKELLSRPARG